MLRACPLHNAIGVGYLIPWHFLYRSHSIALFSPFIIAASAKGICFSAMRSNKQIRRNDGHDYSDSKTKQFI